MSKLSEIQREADETYLSPETPPPYHEAVHSGPVAPLAPLQTPLDSAESSESAVMAQKGTLRQAPSGPMLPVAIPQITTSWKGAFVCPFVRAWAPEMGERGLSQAEFLTFLDGFNEAFVASPVFQSLGYAGLIMQQFYGLNPVQWAGIGLQVTSGLASAAVSYARARAYMKAANKKTFEPYGLHATVLTTKKLAAKVGYPHEKVELLPEDNTQMDDMSDALAVDRPGAQVLSRRMQALAGYVQPLSFDVPPSESSRNFMKRMGEWQSERLTRKQEKRLDKKLDKKREKSDEAYEKKDRKADKIERKVDKLEDKLDESREHMQRRLVSATAQQNPRTRERIEREFARDEAEIQRKIDKVSKKGAEKVEKHSRKADKKHGRIDKRQTKAINKVRWIVISELEDAEADDEIQDEDGLDSLSDASSSD